MRSNISDILDSKKLKLQEKVKNHINKNKHTTTCKKELKFDKKLSTEAINNKTQLKQLDNHLCLTQNIKYNYNSKKIEKTKIKSKNSFGKSPIETLKLKKKNAVKKIFSPKANISSYNTVTGKKNIYKDENKILQIPETAKYGKKINFNDNYHNFRENSNNLKKEHNNKIFSSNDIHESVQKRKIIDISDIEDESLIINNYEENENEDNNNIINTTFPKLASNPFLTLNDKKKDTEEKNKIFFSPNIVNKIKGRCIQQTQLYYNNVKSPSKTKTIVSINSSTTQNSNDTINNLNIYNLDKSKRKKINDLNSNIHVEGEIDKNINNNSQENNKKEKNNYFSLFDNLLITVKNGNEEKFLEIFQKIQKLPKNIITLNFNKEEKDSGNTILHYACQSNNFNIIKNLLKYNCDTNIKNNEKQTPLHIASIKGNKDICKILTENGALFNIYDSQSKTPIHYACLYNHKELLNYFYEIFIETGTDEKICDNLTNNKDIHSLFQKYLLNRNKKEAISQKNLMLIKNEFFEKKEKNKKFNINNSKIKKNESINRTRTDSYSKLCLNTTNSGLNENENDNNILNAKYEIKKNEIKKIKNPKKRALLLKERNTTKKNHLKPLYNAINKRNNNKRKAKNNSFSKAKEKDFNYEVNKTYDDSRPKKMHIINKTQGNNDIPKKIKDIPTNNNNNNNNNIKRNTTLPIKKINKKNEFFNTEIKNNKKTNNNNDNTNLNISSYTSEKQNLNKCFNNDVQSPKNNSNINNPQIINQTMNTTNININMNMNITNINVFNQMSLSLNLIHEEEEEKISTKNFICLAQLGRGSFGEVYLVQKINTKKNYAMKILRKERIMGQNLSRYALAERNVLSLSNHPFIVKLNYAFQSMTKLFLILEYCPGGDLAKHLRLEKKFDEKRAKFYLCEILLALENLHKRNIIFRDLKPDNVVLDNEGHCKLTDFGLSKEGIDNDQYTKSFCGSIAYLAPEVLKKQGHNKSVDWYLLGVLLYEMLTGVTPYYDKNKNTLFYNIEHGILTFPNFVSENAKSLLIGLLQKDPKKRLGGGIRDAEEIKEHKFFEDVDWNKVYEKKIAPPKMMKVDNNMFLFNKPKHFADEKNLEEIFGNNSLEGWTFINKDELM